MNAWLFQDHRQKQKLGDNCPWSVGWYDPQGKKKSKRIGSRSMAEKYARKIEGQLAAGVYQDLSKARWPEFIDEFRTKVMAGMEPSTRQASTISVAHFERIIKPVKVSAINSKTFSDYVAARRTESRNGPNREASGALVSPATINKELRHLRAVVRKATKWRYMATAPEIEFLKEPGKLPTYITPEHFAKLHQHCDTMRWPNDQPFPAGDWWRGLLMVAYMTGWRIGSLLSLRWEDVDMKAATALSRAANNKGKRDQFIPLHPVAIEHLQKLSSFSPVVFPWNHNRRALFLEFHSLQKSAGVKPTGKDWYGFHDLRRAFATMNADKLTPDVLQSLMQHRDYQTTQKYINMARQLNPSVQNLFVPSVAKSGIA